MQSKKSNMNILLRKDYLKWVKIKKLTTKSEVKLNLEKTSADFVVSNFCCCYCCSFFQSKDNKLQRKLVFFNFVSYLTVNMFSTALLTLGSIKHVAEVVSEVKDNTQTIKAEFREGFKETQGKHIWLIFWCEDVHW